MQRDRPLLVLVDEADYFVKAQQEDNYRTLHEMRSLSEEGTAYFILAGFLTLYHSASLDFQSPPATAAKSSRSARSKPTSVAR